MSEREPSMSSSARNSRALIVFATRTGINEGTAHAIADVLKVNYKMDVTVTDLKNGQPDIVPYQNIIVGGGVKSTSVYNEAVDFLEKDFGGKNVALYFCCEDYENPKEQSTEDNTKKVLAKNPTLKPIDVAAFGGCMIAHGKPVMDDLNMNRVREWAVELGQKFYTQSQPDKKGILSIDGGSINSSTQITVDLRNVGSSTLIVNTVYVDDVLQRINSVMLGPNGVQTVIITGNDTNWVDGAVHQVRIVSDGTEVTWSVRAHDPGEHHEQSPNDMRSNVKNPNNELYEKDQENRERQREENESE